jgi:hypothetical protein
MISRWVTRILAVAMCAAASTLAAQSTRCELEQQPTTTLATDSASGAIFVGGKVLIRCPGRGITLRGDSAERYPDHDFMIGHVIYDEPRFHVTSDYLNYFPADEKVIAVGNVNARLPTGSTLVGPIAEYRRGVPRVRPRAQMLARARPTITIVEKDSAGKPTPPTGVIADTVFMDGDSLVYAWGQVVITRPEISATADSVFINEGAETMRLMKTPKLVGKKDRAFTLSGELIDLSSKNRKLQRVLSRANAVAVSDSMTLRADTIDLRLMADLLDHAYAWGAKSRARVLSKTQNMIADSLDVWMPNQKVQLVRALRKAFAEGKPDTARFVPEKPDTTDWLRGDTIVAHFDSLGAKDTAKTPAIKTLVANGNASSLYHLAASDSSERRAAINYIDARTITINFDKQRVATVVAVDSVRGVFIEPKPDSTARKANAAAASAAKSPPGKTPAKNPATPPSRPPAAPPIKPATPTVSLPSRKP